MSKPKSTDRGNINLFFKKIILLVIIFLATIVEANSGLDDWYKEAAESSFSGFVFVAKGQTILFEKGIGLASKKDGRQFTTETVIDILSLTKQFTAAAILKLEEHGDLSVHDTLDNFFEDVPSDKKKITLHHLLTHTSGLGEYYKSDYSETHRDELERYALNSPLRSMPGKEYHYSNVAYSLLGVVIEKVSGQSYEEFLHKELFVPAGMLQTGYRIPKWDQKKIAIGYRSQSVSFNDRLTAKLGYLFDSLDEWGTPLDQNWAEDGPWWSLRANGGLLSTIKDLHKWYLVLEANHVLSENSKTKFYSPYVERNNQGNSHYGYGWIISKDVQGNRKISHDGANPYFFSRFTNFIDDGVVLLVVSNDWRSVEQGILSKLVNALKEEKIITWSE